jgi:putative Mn2+ efflux pump MntP
MMTIVDILLLSVALAMDCFTVSIVGGVIVRRPIGKAVVRMALLFGLFQAAMPLIGWLSTTYFSHYLESVDHWIAFLLLMFVGGKMVKESFAEEDSEPTFNPLRLRTQLLLAVATSIDALAIGISMACLGYNRMSQLTLPLVLIGVTSLLLSLAGYWLGVHFGRVVARQLKPELIGGLVLMFIGIKVLVSHLFA